MKPHKEILKAMVCDAVDEFINTITIEKIEWENCSAIAPRVEPWILYISFNVDKNSSLVKILIGLKEAIRKLGIHLDTYEGKYIIEWQVTVPKKYLESESSEPDEKASKAFREINEAPYIINDDWVIKYKFKNKIDDAIDSYSKTFPYMAARKESRTSSLYVSEGNIDEKVRIENLEDSREFYKEKLNDMLKVVSDYRQIADELGKGNVEPVLTAEAQINKLEQRIEKLVHENKQIKLGLMKVINSCRPPTERLGGLRYLSWYLDELEKEAKDEC